MLQDLAILVAGVVITSVAAWWYARPRLKVFFTPRAEFTNKHGNVPSPYDRVRVESLLFVNGGSRKPVEDVEVVLEFRPQDFAISPHVEVREEQLDAGRWKFTVPKIGPKEMIKADILYVGLVPPAVVSVRSSEGPKVVRPAQFSAIIPPIWQAFLLAMVVVGACAVLFLSVWAVASVFARFGGG
ncbi:hypothetical protein [Maricaulis salignorans]|uniref:hypothetical protein n=1 Tax=Maricaulis salignorans TaxID=144026 RepID=UPI003A8DED95